MKKKYTYRSGKKVYLVKEQDQLVIRKTTQAGKKKGPQGAIVFARKG